VDTRLTDHPIRLLVRADDFGSTRSANLACIHCFQKGIVRSAEIMVPCPWFEEACRLAGDNPGLDIGVHLVVTSEWEGYRWRPLTPCASLIDETGCFRPMVFPSATVPAERTLLGGGWNMYEMETELRAQIELALKRIPRVSHITGHMGWEHADERLAALFTRLARSFGFRANTSAEPLTYMGSYEKSGDTGAEVRSFIAALRGLKPGTWLFLEHPAYEDTETAGLYHADYHGVARHRGDVTRVLTSPEVLQAVQDFGITLIGYRDLHVR